MKKLRQTLRIRDEKMKALVSPDKESITAFVCKVRPLFEELGVSTILVVGGSGDFFSAADAVIMMDEQSGCREKADLRQ